jgi:hypothetical protein
MVYHEHPECVQFDPKCILQWWNVLGKLILKVSLIKNQEFFNLGRSFKEIKSHKYEVHTSTDFFITYKLKEKIRREEISRDPTFYITQPTENYCVAHRRYRNNPVYDIHKEPFDIDVKCTSKTGSITYRLSFLTCEMYN